MWFTSYWSFSSLYILFLRPLPTFINLYVYLYIFSRLYRPKQEFLFLFNFFSFHRLKYGVRISCRKNVVLWQSFNHGVVLGRPFNQDVVLGRPFNHGVVLGWSVNQDVVLLQWPSTVYKFLCILLFLS